MIVRKGTGCLKQLSVTIPREQYRYLGDFLDQNLERELRLKIVTLQVVPPSWRGRRLKEI